MSDSYKCPVRTFGRGIHPANDGKSLSRELPVRRAPLLENYFVALPQNIGAPPSWVVKVGDEVKKGQLLAAPGGKVSSAIHAPTSGKVAEFLETPGPTGAMVSTLKLTADGKDEWTELPPPLDWKTASREELLQRIADCGVIGMGGAAFPTQIKLAPPPNCKIDFLVLNGAECEPYLTADHRLMLEQPERVLTGAAIASKILGNPRTLIGVEDNKRDAIDRLNRFAGEYGVEVLVLEARYPQGSEKQLIYALTGRRVPEGALPAAAGCVVQNVATAAAIADAVCEGKPLIERIVTVSGEALMHPENLLLRIGTPVLEAVRLCGGVREEPGKLLLGGPMMGFAQKNFDGMVWKNTSGILLLPPRLCVQYESTGCLRCGRCMEVCPMNLVPCSLASAAESGKMDLALQNNVLDCLECGACAYACPAHRPLVQHIRRAKAEIRKMKKK